MFDQCGNSSFDPTENNIPVFNNVTKIQDPVTTGQCYPPAGVPACGDYGGTPPDCGGPRRPCSCGAGLTKIIDNCYTPDGTFENNATSIKRGFKSARAAKVWHGRYGWMSHDQGGATDIVDFWGVVPIARESYQGAPDPIHYLSLNIAAQYSDSWDYPQDPSANYSGSITANRQFTVDRYSGNINASSSNNLGAMTGSAPSTDQYAQRVQDIVNSHQDANGFGYLIGLFLGVVANNITNWPIDINPDDGLEPGTLTGSGSSWTMTRYTKYNSGDSANPDSQSTKVLAIKAAIDLNAGTYEEWEWGPGMGAWATDPTYGQYWTQPWVQTRHEKVTFTSTTWTHTIDSDTYPDGGWMHSHVSQSVTSTLGSQYAASDLLADAVSMLALWNLRDDKVMPWRMDTNVAYAPLVRRNETSIPISPTTGGPGLGWQQDPATLLDGAIIGGPTPAGYGPYWSWTHARVDWNGEAWLRTYGQYAPDWCKHCTEWTNDREAQDGYYGAWVRCNGTYIEVQKWAEIILLTKPAHNFARPCGSDRSAIDQTTINCTSNPTGSLRWPNAPSSCASNDTTKKGTFLTRTFVYNYRDVGEAARINTLAADRVNYNAQNHDYPLPNIASMTTPRGGSPLTNISVIQRTAGPSRCPPIVIVCSPNGESGNITLDIPSPTIDGRYGSFGWLGIRQWMTDPLWQPPVVPCDQQSSVVYREDATGSCGNDPGLPRLTDNGLYEIDYYSRPWEEAISTPPTGAPPLPAGLRLGCVNLGTADAPNWVGPDCDGPSSQGFAPWTYQTRQEQYNCPDTAIIDGTL